MLYFALAAAFHVAATALFLRVVKKPMMARLAVMIGDSLITIGLVVFMIVFNESLPEDKRYNPQSVALIGLFYGFIVTGVINLLATLVFFIISKKHVPSAANP